MIPREQHGILKDQGAQAVSPSHLGIAERRDVTSDPDQLAIVSVASNVRITEGDVDGILGHHRNVDGEVGLLVGRLVHAKAKVVSLHGDKDALVPVEQAKTLDEKMKAVGASHTLMIFKGQGHGFGGEAAKKAADATWEFFARHLKPYRS